MKELTLHQQDQARLQVLNSVLAEEITVGPERVVIPTFVRVFAITRLTMVSNGGLESRVCWAA